MDEVRKQLKPWEQELLRIVDEVQEEAIVSKRLKRKREVNARSSASSVGCDKHEALHIEYDPGLFRKCPVCARDRIIEEYEAAVITLYDLQDLDFQLMQVIFDTYDNSGIREERNRRRDEIIDKWKKHEDEVRSRLHSIRDSYDETFQNDPPKH